MISLAAQAASAYGAGLLTSLSPCVYPMLPITLGFLGMQAGTGRRGRVALFALGQGAAFVALGVLAVQAGEALGFTSQLPGVRLGVGLLLILGGVFSLLGRLPGLLARFDVERFLRAFSARMPPSLAAFALGFGGALVMSPCTTPVLSGVLALIATEGSTTSGLTAIVAYAAGFSTLLLVVGLGIAHPRLLPRSGRWMVRLHKAGALALIAFGGYYVVTAAFA